MSWEDRLEGRGHPFSRSLRQDSWAEAEGAQLWEWECRPQPQGPPHPLWPPPGPLGQACSERPGWGRLDLGRSGWGRLVNAGSGAGQAGEAWGAVGVALWGPGGCCQPDGEAEPGGSQDCQRQGTGMGLGGRSGCWRPGAVAWWAGLVLGVWLWRKERGSEVSV